MLINISRINLSPLLTTIIPINSHINELGVSMKRDPRDVIIPFFRRLEEKEVLIRFFPFIFYSIFYYWIIPPQQHFQGFSTAVEEFLQRIVKRAIEKRKEMDAGWIFSTLFVLNAVLIKPVNNCLVVVKSIPALVTITTLTCIRKPYRW